MEWLVLIVIGFVIYRVTRKKKKPEPKPDFANFKLEPVTRRNDPTSSSPARHATDSDTLARWGVTVSLSTSSGSRSNNKDPGRWLPPSESITIKGITIKGGLFYVGGLFPGQSHYDVDNCLVDPTLTVAKTAVGAQMNYWPSYSTIGATARRGYLEWLASDRSDPNADIGYVFLYFYGIERRMFVDKAIAEAPTLIAEVRRLKALRTDNNSFQRYAEAFLQSAQALMGVTPTEPDLTDVDAAMSDLKLPVLMYLGRKLAQQEPLNAFDSLAWLLGAPDVYSKTALTRCWDEFKLLWAVRFAAKYPKGRKVSTPKTLLKAHYRACSGNFGADIPLAGDFPDITAVSAPMKPLRELYNRCIDDLEAYSRLLGRKPQTRGKPESILLLPKEIQHSVANSPLKAISEYLTTAFSGDDTFVTSAEKMLETFSVEQDEKKTLAAQMAQIAPAFDAMNVGFEPDKRYGSSSFPKDGTVVLFRRTEQQEVNPEKPEYQIAKTLIEVTSLAAAADGGVNPAELAAVKADIQALNGLNPAEKQRLAAYAKLLAEDAPRQQGVMSRLAKLSSAEKARVASSAIASVLADGHADPAEMKFLEKLYKALGMPADELYSAVHRGAIVIDEPVTVVAEEAPRGRAIPKKPAPAAIPASSGIKIDMARLERIKSETSAVSNLLADIFVEETPAPAATAPIVVEASAFEGLDAAHARLVVLFLAQPEYDRGAFEEEARGLQLMPDGAVETINEWAFDTFDEPLLDGEDTIVVAEHLVAKLKEMEVRA
ncbi:TerB N-terminal domain-containing protein [Ferrovibrio sp.]|uniref:tellurite resistance TerB family protein n=1 Tax=Ferrovibrio sp. TaxID=1917215 RepID=UPI0025BED6E6|nr:TerB N-terminal domain-containing protein [Ferrovibrio sp.]